MAEEKNKTAEDEIPQSNAAKRLKGLGIDPSAPPEDSVVVEPVGFLENFWYHHKWKTIISVCALIVFLIATLQMCTQNSYDLYVMYAGPGYLTPNEARTVQSVCNQLSADEGGAQQVMFSSVYYLNDDQIEQKRAQAEARDEKLYIDLASNASALERFQMEVVAGNSVIFLLDPFLYESVKAGGGLLPLVEVLDEIPASAIDEYGIRLGDTALYKNISALQRLPKDTVLCIRRVSAMSVFKGQKKTEAMHERHTELFRQMVIFEPAE